MKLSSASVQTGIDAISSLQNRKNLNMEIRFKMQSSFLWYNIIFFPTSFYLVISMAHKTCVHVLNWMRVLAKRVHYIHLQHGMLTGPSRWKNYSSETRSRVLQAFQPNVGKDIFKEYHVYCTLYTVYCILYTVYCILYTVYSIQHTAYSILSIQYT